MAARRTIVALLFFTTTLVCCENAPSRSRATSPSPPPSPSPSPPVELPPEPQIVLLEAAAAYGEWGVEVPDCQGRIGCTLPITLRFAVTVVDALPTTASLQVDLLSDEGERRAHGSVDGLRLAPGQATAIDCASLSTTVPLPTRTQSIWARLMSDDPGHSVLLDQTLQVGFRLVAAPAGPAPSPPRILSFDWDSAGLTGYHACPLPEEGNGLGESVLVWCEAKDDDGDAFTLALNVEDLGPGEISGSTRETRAFPASSEEHEIQVQFLMLERGSDVRARCEAVDSRGLASEAELTIACAGVP
jgi:hypothetical protein